MHTHSRAHEWTRVHIHTYNTHTNLRYMHRVLRGKGATEKKGCCGEGVDKCWEAHGA